MANANLRPRFQPIGDVGPSAAVAGYIEAARAAERVGQRHLARSHYEEALRSLTRGDELPTATTILRCLTIPNNELKALMLRQPNVMYRMLQVEARRLRTAIAWRG